ncbi:MAG: hypothetical protein GXO00_02100 [Candidatus Diapherotrites archaeon]|nr:hypothetical protein [Candidatus Diapherotrites archaeon]
MPTITIEVPKEVAGTLDREDIERLFRLTLFLMASKKLSQLLSEDGVEDIVKVLEEVM